jgi:hypothetical protein
MGTLHVKVSALSCTGTVAAGVSHAPKEFYQACKLGNQLKVGRSIEAVGSTKWYKQQEIERSQCSSEGLADGCFVPWISLAKSADVTSGTTPRQHSPHSHARHPGSQQTVTMALSMTANLRTAVLGNTQELRARPAASSAARCPVVVRAQQQEV